MRRIVAALAIAFASLRIASAAPGDLFPDGNNLLGFNCLGYDYATDPAPGTDAWTHRDQENQFCSLQRYFDRGWQPLGNTAPTYGQDPYRTPTRAGNAGTRFRFDAPAIGTIPATEIYRPCPTTGPDVCTNMPAGLQTFDPPYPVVVVFHGFTASKQLHRWTTQVLAEEGYMAIAVNGTWPDPLPTVFSISLPNSQTSSNGTEILAWLNAHQGLAAEADTNRVGFAGHSQGGGVILGFQGDPRVHALVVYDGGTTAAASNTSQPIMYQGEDGVGFAFIPPSPSATAPATGPEAASGYGDLRGRDVDSMGLSFRAFSHTDYNGNGGPAGNRWAELTSNYFTLAWFDRYLKGKLVLTGCETPEQETAERSYRQSIAQNAYDRLRVTPDKLFDDSADVHNISMGFWDWEKAIASGDLLFGGNVLYALAGTPIRWRLSFYAPSVCFISVPDYVGGESVSYGGADSVLAHRADSTVDGDMRVEGCPERF